MEEIRPIIWDGGVLKLLDQRLLPHQERYLTCSTFGQVRDCIREMVVRGAPAIGVSAAFGMVLAAQNYLEQELATPEKGSIARERFFEYFKGVGSELIRSRPTAVNLFWGVERMLKKVSGLGNRSGQVLLRELEQEALAIYLEDIETNKSIGAKGAELIPENSTLLTHCNAGALATAGYGTALGIIRSAFQQGKLRNVLADETRPLLQGARLTCWELQKEGIPVQLIADGAAGHFISRGEVTAVITGADRIAANGDTANKIGTYPLALLAKEHQIPFYIAAPLSTVDLSTPTGMEIVIEEREETEVLYVGEQQITPPAARARNPAFDVTPAHLVTALVTEKAVVYSPDENKIRQLFEGEV